jgi:pantoate--beta-alanine ligase
MKTLKTLSELEKLQDSLNGRTLALVPTMGALHEGHISLVKEGLRQADICLPYIFVNPTQFAEGEDLETYPRTLDEDLQKLEETGVQAVWLPKSEDIYPDGVKITHKAGALAKPLEGESRPHFFDGVVTVLHRMFDLSKPDMVMMGEKDFQQLQVVRHMVSEYEMPIEIIGVRTARDRKGLALSSRNAYLNEKEYESAAELNKILVQFAQNMVSKCEAKRLLRDVGFDNVDYCVQVNDQTFLSDNPNRVLVAAWIGTTRLIDNMPMMA